MTIEDDLAAHAVEHDLVERLRGQHWMPGVDFVAQALEWMREAADEIERLRTEKAPSLHEVASVIPILVRGNPEVWMTSTSGDHDWIGWQCALLESLGIDPNQIHRAVLEISGDEAPIVTVEWMPEKFDSPTDMGKYRIEITLEDRHANAMVVPEGSYVVPPTFREGQGGTVTERAPRNPTAGTSL